VVPQQAAELGSHLADMVGLDRGDVDKDEEGIRTMKVLGANMAWVMKKLYP
jgi:hypothetical protein